MLGLAPTAQHAIDAFDDEYYAESIDASTSLLAVNVFEALPALLQPRRRLRRRRQRRLAIDDFELALELAPVEKQCDVRLNLALGWERFGDAYVEAKESTRAR